MERERKIARESERMRESQRKRQRKTRTKTSIRYAKENDREKREREGEREKERQKERYREKCAPTLNRVIRQENEQREERERERQKERYREGGRDKRERERDVRDIERESERERHRGLPYRVWPSQKIIIGHNQLVYIITRNYHRKLLQEIISQYTSSREKCGKYRDTVVSKNMIRRERNTVRGEKRQRENVVEITVFWQGTDHHAKRGHSKVTGHILITLVYESQSQ